MQFYIYKLNRFEALKKDSSLDYNTHGETIDIYKHMIDVWKSLSMLFQFVTKLATKIVMI